MRVDGTLLAKKKKVRPPLLDQAVLDIITINQFDFDDIQNQINKGFRDDQRT